MSRRIVSNINNPPEELAVAHVWGECLPISTHQSDCSAGSEPGQSTTSSKSRIRMTADSGNRLNEALSQAPLCLLTFTPELLSG
ncbi:hypothetical protein CesoFtcFv8_017651 [Champsocephalus esox]|uniref:Uncharacterized protein n=1 Tax=Champsocephalus esox TaxID=159716 RepID=A0AAN8BL46_9TELE|nr:hypothetical protein CesoFtcFv8_017651 [Champsocephalus esox]